MKIITITFSDPVKPCEIDVHVDGKSTGGMTYEEALGLLAQLLPCSGRAVDWLKPDEYWKDRLSDQIQFRKPMPKPATNPESRTEPTSS
jgi:hypothetical protein